MSSARGVNIGRVVPLRSLQQRAWGCEFVRVGSPGCLMRGGANRFDCGRAWSSLICLVGSSISVEDAVDYRDDYHPHGNDYK